MVADVNAIAQAAGLEVLLGAVRRRLWLGHALVALRLALWGTAGLLLLAALAHVATGPISVTGLRTAIALLWGVVASWALTQRPGPAECATWADRNLGGESAYSTWLESGSEGRRGRAAPALEWLEQWIAAAASGSLRRLTERRDSTLLARPLATAAICAALAAVVLQVPIVDRRDRVESAGESTSSLQWSGVAAPRAAAPLDETALAEELQTALRSKEPSRKAVPPAPQPSSAAPGNEYDGARVAESAGSLDPARTAAGDAPASLAARESSTAGSGRGANGGGDDSGREAGDSRDDRGDQGASRAVPPVSAARRSDAIEQTFATGRQADMDRLATFDDSLAGTVLAPQIESRIALAAVPPPATVATRLTPAQAAYVQAWRAASEMQP